jgi:uncharacterized protein YpmB
MIKNKLKYLIGIIVVVFLVSIVNISYKSIKPYAIDRDIAIDGVLELNNTGINNYSEYLLNIKLKRNMVSY